MGKIVCFGELLLRLAAPARELLLQTSRLDVHVGGAEANVAVGLACLGHESAMVSRVPANALGDSAIGHLRRYGVTVDRVARGEGRMGLYFHSPGAGLRGGSIVYDREGSSFALAGADDYDWDKLLAGADLLHLSGITPALGERPADTAIAAAEVARSRGLKVSFDGNYRAQLWKEREPKNTLCRLVEKADILFGNYKDVSLLLGREFTGDGEERRRQAAESAFEAFPNLQMIASTERRVDDSNSHLIAARIDRRECGLQTGEVVVGGIVDRIGTGDAFAAGVLHGLLTGADQQLAANYGLALACLKHGLAGDASLFGQSDIDAFFAGERDVRR